MSWPVRIETINGRESLVCLLCQSRSWNPTDIREHYCGACHRFLDEVLYEFFVRLLSCVQAVYRQRIGGVGPVMEDAALDGLMRDTLRAVMGDPAYERWIASLSAVPADREST